MKKLIEENPAAAILVIMLATFGFLDYVSGLAELAKRASRDLSRIADALERR